MRVGWVVLGSLEQVTGGYVYDRKVVAGLRRLGHDVEVISLGSALPREGLALLPRLTTGRFDVVVADELCHRATAVLFSALALLGFSARRVLLVHHLEEWEDQRARLSEWTCLRLAHHIVVTSHTSRERLRRALGVEASVCVPGVEPSKGVLALRRAATSRKDGSARKSPTQSARLLFVGTVTPRKRLHALIEALAALPECDYTLTVVGDDRRDLDYACRVRALLRAHESVARRTEWLGRVDEGRLHGLYRSSDVLVSTSSFEGYGMALAEAVAAGLGVVSTDVGAVPEVLRRGEEALLVPLDEPQKLSAALRSVIDDPALRAQMRRCAAQREFSSWDDCTRGFARALTRACTAT